MLNAARLYQSIIDLRALDSLITRKLSIAPIRDWSRMKRIRLAHIFVCSYKVVRFLLSWSKTQSNFFSTFLRKKNDLFEFAQKLKTVEKRGLFHSMCHGVGKVYCEYHYSTASFKMHKYEKLIDGFKHAAEKWSFWLLHVLFHIWLEN